MRNEVLLRILLAENNEGDARLIKEMLKSELSGGFHIDNVKRLTDALKYLSMSKYDALLLDLSLIGSESVDSLVIGCGQVPDIPIIAMAVADDEALALKAIRSGMQDYLVKTKLDRKTLTRSIFYAIERHKLKMRSGLNEKDIDKECPPSLMERMSVNSKSPITEQLFGGVPLSQNLQDTFNELVDYYSDFLSKAIKQKACYGNYEVYDMLRAMSEQLGFLGAGPRDILEIHVEALKRQTRQVPNSKAMDYIEEGRLMVLELMGYLISYYRKHSCASARQTDLDYNRKDKILKIKDKIGRLKNQKDSDGEPGNG